MEFITMRKVIHGREFIIETGKMAKQADGAVLVRSGKNAVLVTACMSKSVVEGTDFFPLTVHYIEKFYAAGKIPGGYIKREGRPSDREVLISRLIDRPIRPLFPENFYNEVQVIATTLSADQSYPTDIMGIIGASAALAISPIPFLEPVGGVRICYKDGQYIVNPSFEESAAAVMNIVVAGSRRGITMVEGGSKEVGKEILLKALEIGQDCINQIVDMINELAAKINPVKIVVPAPVYKLAEEQRAAIRSFVTPKMEACMVNPDKKDRQAKVDAVKDEMIEKFSINKEDETYGEVKKLFEEIEVEVFRSKILNEGIRPDGRKPTEIRPITIELDILDSAHGSALFTRGQTQSLGIVTLGSMADVQYIDSIESEEETTKRFMLHYNFPPFSTGEVKRSLSPSRREIGHGHLAERAIDAVLPTLTDFPYTIRMVSEILESNGSSSMATVCSSSLSLMAAGVPVKTGVAGVAMGLIWDQNSGKYQVLTDIQGLEDHYGDMDFKVAGTKDGITAFQMDIKTIGLTSEIMTNAINQALDGQMYILNKMNAVIENARPHLAETAPKIRTIMIPETEIGSVIGSGGRVIKKIMADCKVAINIEDSGQVSISGKDSANIEKCVEIVNHIANGFEKGEIVEGYVIRVEDYGIFVELVPGQSGLLHKSNMKEKVDIRSTFKIGDRVKARIMDVDERKRVSLIDSELEYDPNRPRREERPRFDRDRGGFRGGDRGGDRGGRGFDRDRGPRPSDH